MKAIKQIFYSLVLIVSIVLMASCTSTSKKADGTKTEESNAIDQEEVKKKIREVVYELPTPFEFSTLLNEIGAAYNAEVLNNADNAGKYITERAKAINLGIYAADFGYVFTYEQKVESNQYLKSIKQLLDELNVDIDLYQFAQEKQALELKEKDTIVNTVTKIFYNVYNELSENNLPELSLLTASGIWIESVYIATNIAEDTYKNTEIVKLIIEQRNSLNSLIETMENYSGNELIDNIISKLKGIKVVYDNAEEGLTTDEYNTIVSAISQLRAELI